jgi:hypothetical protein
LNGKALPTLFLVEGLIDKAPSALSPPKSIPASPMRVSGLSSLCGLRLPSFFVDMKAEALTQEGAASALPEQLKNHVFSAHRAVARRPNRLALSLLLLRQRILNGYHNSTKIAVLAAGNLIPPRVCLLTPLAYRSYLMSV